MFKKNRTYKLKNSVSHFLCPLCSTTRQLRYRSKLQARHYVQILISTAFLTMICFPFFGFKSMVSAFVMWAVFEAINKMNFRKEIPCPHCGFDATWYRKDVKKARELVNGFWNPEEKIVPDANQNPSPVISEENIEDDGPNYFQ